MPCSRARRSGCNSRRWSRRSRRCRCRRCRTRRWPCTARWPMRADALRSLAPAHWLLLAALALLPFGMASELPVLVGAVLGGVALLRGRIDWQQPGVRLALALGLAYWLPQLLSAFDSAAPGKT